MRTMGGFQRYMAGLALGLISTWPVLALDLVTDGGSTFSIHIEGAAPFVSIDPEKALMVDAIHP